MKKFRIFKQVPRIIFGPNSLDRISELLPDRKSNNDYYVFIIDDVFKEKKIEVRLSVKKNDFIEWFPASLKEPTTDQVDFLSEKVNEDISGEITNCSYWNWRWKYYGCGKSIVSVIV